MHIATQRPPLTVLLTTILWYFLETSTGFCQEHQLYQLEKQIMDGDKSSLFDLATYFDSKKTVIEFLGYHRIETTESSIAKRIMRENFLLTDAEFVIHDSTTQKEFADFLTPRKNGVVFSNLAGAFIITPLEERAVHIEFRELTPERIEQLKTQVKPFFQYSWTHTTRLDSLIRHRNPAALLTIASEFFKTRTRFNRYHFQPEEFTNLLQYLMLIEIGVEDEEDKITWHIEKNYYDEVRLNLLCYFARFHKDYVWDETISAFVNPNNRVQKTEQEEKLFQLLDSENDSIAFRAFTDLTQCNPDKVGELAKEYTHSDVDANHELPTFPYRFLTQLSLFTQYCRSNNIDFIGSDTLQANIFKLCSELTFPERRKLENDLIVTLSLSDIHALEYWALIHENSWGLTFSAGRILDIFYSRNWNKLMTNQAALNAYLKKSALFDALGIIGICNNYLKKFHNSPPSVIQMLQTCDTDDMDIQSQIKKIISTSSPAPKKNPSSVQWDGNYDATVKDLKKQLSKLTHSANKSKETDRTISKLLSQISYAQIAIALEAMEHYSFEQPSEKYSFIEQDFGFFPLGDFDKKEVRDRFLSLYSKHSEYELYDYYLTQANIDYKTSNGGLDFDKIYELIKYDVVTPLAGGGGGKQENEVYELLKLLELTFKTTLGFPKKLCNSNNVYGCHSDERARAWMEYLQTNKKLKLDHHDPPSFTFDD